jgi:hypothetical protein
MIAGWTTTTITTITTITSTAPAASPRPTSTGR